MSLVDVEPKKGKTQQTTLELRVYERRQHHQQDTGQAPRSNIAPSLESSLNLAPNPNNNNKDQLKIDKTNLSLYPNPNSSSLCQPKNNESEIGSSHNQQIQELDIIIAQRKGLCTHHQIERFVL